MTNKDDARCKKCGRLASLCFCDLYCQKCGEPLFMCSCDAGCGGCGGLCDQDDGANYHEVTICMICEVIIDDDAVPGEGSHFCENCGDAICPKCAQPALDEAGEIVFVCKTCVDKNRNDTCG